MILSFDNLSKYFADKNILMNVSGSINEGDRIGIVGQNGTGKTTLLNVLFDKMPFESGSLNISSKISVGYLKQNDAFDTFLTIFEEMKKVFSNLYEIKEKLEVLEGKMAQNITDAELKQVESEYSSLLTFFEQQDGYNTEVKIKTVLNGMGFSDKSHDTPFNTLSGGEKTRLCLAKLLLLTPDILVLDEPTNHLDIETLTWLEEYLKSYKGAIITVSHDRYFLDKIVTSIWDISNNSLVSYKGNYSKYLVLKEEREKRLLKEYEAQQQKIDELKTYAEKNIARASTSKSAKSRLAALDRMDVLEDPRHSIRKMKMEFEYAFEPHFDVLSVKEMPLTVGFGKDEVVLCDNITFNLERGDKLAVIGSNGAGKTTLIKKLSQNPSINKCIKWGGNVKISYYDQHLNMLNPENTVMEELWSRFPNRDPLSIRTTLGRALFSGETIYKKVKMLSGGERARLSLAIIMEQKPNVLIMDEPTNHLDLFVREILEEALLSFSGTLILVSHDRYLLNKIPNRILNLENKKADFYLGGYGEYLLKKQIVSANGIKTEVEKPLKINQNIKGKDKRAKDAQKRNQIKALEKEIEECEEKIKGIEKELQNPEVFSDFVKTSELYKELEETKQKHESSLEKWLELSE